MLPQYHVANEVTSVIEVACLPVVMSKFADSVLSHSVLIINLIFRQKLLLHVPTTRRATFSPMLQSSQPRKAGVGEEVVAEET